VSSLTGTRTLTRLALRLDRVRLTVWVLVIGLTPAITAAQYRKLYPTAESLAQVSGVISNPSLVAINGPLYAAGSIGALTAWKIMATELILVALMAIFTVIRHSRAEEEDGRTELIGAGVVGRRAPLSAALLTAAVGSLGGGLLAAIGLIGAKQPATGGVALGAAVAFTGLVFAAVAAVGAQLTSGSRTAIGIAGATLAAVYLLRAVGDSGPGWVSWLSPMGWAMRIRPFAHERWWLLLPLLALIGLLTTIGYALAGRRDLGFGLLPDRPGPAAAAPSLSNTFALAWRLQRGTLLAWLIGAAVIGAVFGGAAKAIGTAHLDNKQLSDMLARLGGSSGLLNAYLGAVIGLTGLVITAYAVQATLRLRAEETAGRLEPVLATRTGRIGWVLSHLAFAVVGTTLLLAVAGALAGVAYGSSINDTAGQTGRLLVAALVQAPAAWVVVGIGAALFGLVPRLSGLTWAALGACVLILEVGEILGLSHWALDVSPFAHVPKLPGAAFTATPLIWLTVVAALLGAVGLAAFRRRDVPE
jgi:ABC-2 type transport system permease protein